VHAFYGAPQGLLVRGSHAILVNPPRRKRDDADRSSVLKYLYVQFFTQASAQSLGIVEVPDLPLPEDDRCREERPGQGPTPGFVRPRQRASSLRQPCGVEGVEGAALYVTPPVDTAGDHTLGSR
jgi:hypothetical protein